jgi:saxitoxin biosynthesis operon SxtJ-like protein
VVQKRGATDRSFGIVFTAFFLLLALVPLISGNSIQLLWFIASIIVAFITIIKPSILAPFNRYWLRFGLLLHHIVSPIILGVMYFLVFTPIGLTMRALNKRPLQLKLEPERNSYWIIRDPKGPSSDSIKNQF